MTKSLVQQQFGAHAAAYATSVVHAKGASLGRLVELVKPESHWQALDIATGAGHTAAAFAPHVARVIASDITDEMLDEIESALLADGTVRNNDVLVIISGSPMWVTGTTNLLKFHRVGERR